MLVLVGPSDPSTLLQLSDLHLRAPYAEDDWFASTLRWVDRERPDAIVVTGDLTDEGTPAQLEHAWRYLDELAARTSRLGFCWGNHDLETGHPAIPEQHRASYLRRIELEHLVVQLVETSLPGERNGALDLAQLAAARDGRWSVVGAHHNLVSVPGAILQHEVLAHAGDVLAALVRLDIDAWLAGHKHVAHAWELGALTLTTCGSPAPARAPGATREALAFRATSDRLEVVAVDPERGTSRALATRTREHRA